MVEHASDPPSPWAGYRKCMENVPRCSHVLILQDDVLLADNFVAAVEQIAVAQPDTPVCLFLSWLPRDVAKHAQRAQQRGTRYVSVSLRAFMPIVAVLWPRQKLLDFAAWAEQNPGLPGQREPRSDDAMAGRWKMTTRQTVVACVPSIVNHPDLEPSTIGKQPQWGKVRRRDAILFTADATQYDWSNP